MAFFTALLQPDNAFLRLSLAVGLAASIAFGIIGTYVVTRRISYLAGAVSHCVLGGIGLSLWLASTGVMKGVDPVYGALAAALVAAFIIGRFGRRPGQREETMIGATWAIGMAIGIIFIDLTPGYFDLASYLFGDILLVSYRDLARILALDLVIILFAAGFYHQLLAVCFDEEFARLRGLKVEFYYQALLALTAVTVVLMIRVVGIVMVIAMLTLPAATGALFARRLVEMMLLAILFAAIAALAGLTLSYNLNLSSGPVIVMVSGIIYLTAAGGRKLLARN
jgi:zinc transport system permease protein